MEMFIAALIAVGTMFVYAVPGYATVKLGMIKKDSIRAFAVILMYVCQPCLTISSLLKATYSWEYFKQVLVFFAVAFALQILMLTVFYFVFKKRGVENVKYRVASIATAFGNVGFMGVPLLEAIFPPEIASQAMILSVAFLIGLNLLGWTVGSYIVSQDKQYISVKKTLLNPIIFGLLIGLPIFFTGWKVPVPIANMIHLLGKMSTPMCMIILGMRLATVSVKSIFIDPFQYLIIAIKQVVMPLIALVMIWWLPLDLFIRQTMFILAAAPVASLVLNFSELIGEGQETAANLVLLGTGISVVTIPLLTLLLNVMP